MVNVAFDAPVDFAPAARKSRMPSAGCTKLAEVRPLRRRLSSVFCAGSHHRRRPWRPRPFQRDGKLSGIATGLRDLDIKMGGLQPSDLIIVAGPSRHGQDRARHQHRL